MTRQVANRIPVVGRIAKMLRGVLKRLRTAVRRASFTNSADYWEQRYRAGRDSGPGSYGALAEFKAQVLNEFVASNNVASVVEFGCGDGNQLTLARYPKYVGFDVSPAAVRQCRQRFAADETKRFELVADYAGQSADMAMSLDVIFHLVEDPVFDDYMNRLFEAAKRFVVIYASNYDSPPASTPPHVRHRRFTNWIEKHRPEWRQVLFVPNRFPLDAKTGEGSFADFYFFHAGNAL